MNLCRALGDLERAGYLFVGHALPGAAGYPTAGVSFLVCSLPSCSRHLRHARDQGGPVIAEVACSRVCRFAQRAPSLMARTISSSGWALKYNRRSRSRGHALILPGRS